MRSRKFWVAMKAAALLGILSSTECSSIEQIVWTMLKSNNDV